MMIFFMHIYIYILYIYNVQYKFYNLNKHYLLFNCTLLNEEELIDEFKASFFKKL